MRSSAIAALAGISILSLAVCATAYGQDPRPKAIFVPALKTTTTSIGQPLTFPQADAEITAVVVTIPVGGASPFHKHPHQRIAYILEGTMFVEQEGGETKNFPAGSVLVEMRDEWHRAGAFGNSQVKLLVIDIAPKGGQTTINK